MWDSWDYLSPLLGQMGTTLNMKVSYYTKTAISYRRLVDMSPHSVSLYSDNPVSMLTMGFSTTLVVVATGFDPVTPGRMSRSLYVSLTLEN